MYVEQALHPQGEMAPKRDAVPSDSGLQALCLVARLHRVAVEPGALAHQLGKPASEGCSTTNVLLATKHIGLKAKLVRSTGDRLSLVALPALALMNDGRVVVLAQCDGQRVLFQEAVGSSEASRPTIEPLSAFAQQWTGELILITSRASVAGELAKFDLSWFVPSLVKHRKLLGEVLLISLFLQLFALVSPVFFQVVMNKVLVHRGLTTLDVLVLGLLLVVVLDSVLTALSIYQPVQYLALWVQRFPKRWTTVSNRRISTGPVRRQNRYCQVGRGALNGAVARCIPYLHVLYCFSSCAYGAATSPE